MGNPKNPNLSPSLFSSMLLAFCVIAVGAGCGANVFKSAEKKDPAEDSTLALERNEPTTAINILTAALEDDPSNEQYLSLLAMAYAQRAGVDPLTFVQKMASDSSSSSASGDANGVTALFGVMPPATSDNISDVDHAVALLGNIPPANLMAADKLKLAMFQTAAMTLRAKALDKNGDGVLSPEEVLDLSAASATTILSQLADAAILLGADLGLGDATKSAGGSVTKIQDAIAAMPGDTQEEKLKSYLATKQSQQSTTGSDETAPTAIY